MVVFANEETRREIEEIIEGKAERKRRRAKGLQYVREVKEILYAQGCQVEGPMYKIRWIPKKGASVYMEKGEIIPRQVHKDFFGVFDLISFRKDLGYIFHQVSIWEERSRKVKAILKVELRGWIWSRIKQGQRIAYDVASAVPGRDLEHIGIFKKISKEKEPKGK